jgi:hypothetical protein
MMTTQKQVRKAFWDAAARGEFGSSLNITPKRITNYSGTEKMHNTDTRCAFVDFVDYLSKSGELAEGLAERVTLD